jgi:hypothetical protein
MVRTSILTVSLLATTYYPGCTPQLMPTSPAEDAPLAELWQRPVDLASRDLYYGPWGREHAPDAAATYTFVERKRQGTNPGLTVTDAREHDWHVKQPPHNDQGDEGPIEVVLSRVLSGVGYHQPPVYFVPSISVQEGKRVHVEPGGRFRLTEKSLKHVSDWSWQQNPFVGMRAYQGLLVILVMFNSSDLKNENNALYKVKNPGPVKQWYVVRDLGTALGETGRLAPQRGDADIFERTPFITGVTNGFVTFNYHGWHQELFQKITTDDVLWACALLGELSDRQWADAFRAGGYSTPLANRFIRRLHEKIAEGERLGDAASLRAPAPGLRSSFAAVR